MRVLADYLEFLHQVDVRDHDVCRAANVGIDDSVKEVELRPVLLAMERWISESRSGNSYVAFYSADAFVLRGRDRSYAGS